MDKPWWEVKSSESASSDYWLPQMEEAMRQTLHVKSIAGWPTKRPIPLYVTIEVFAFLSGLDARAVKRYCRSQILDAIVINGIFFVATSELLLPGEKQIPKAPF